MANFGEAKTFYADRQSDEQKKTGLNVQYTVRETSKDSDLTLNVEMSVISQITSIPDWKDKISLQLSSVELTGFCEVLFGLSPKAEFKFHGPDRNKGMTIYNNNSKGVLLQLSEAGRMLQHMLNHNQRIELGVFVIRRQADAWKMSVSDVLAVLRQSVILKKAL